MQYTRDSPGHVGHHDLEHIFPSLPLLRVQHVPAHLERLKSLQPLLVSCAEDHLAINLLHGLEHLPVFFTLVQVTIVLVSRIIVLRHIIVVSVARRAWSGRLARGGSWGACLRLRGAPFAAASPDAGSVYAASAASSSAPPSSSPTRFFLRYMTGQGGKKLMFGLMPDTSSCPRFAPSVTPAPFQLHFVCDQCLSSCPASSAGVHGPLSTRYTTHDHATHGTHAMLRAASVQHARQGSCTAALYLRKLQNGAVLEAITN
eukprot:2207545-Pleurochrysis_carterae.AAC.3